MICLKVLVLLPFIFRILSVLSYVSDIFLFLSLLLFGKQCFFKGFLLSFFALSRCHKTNVFILVTHTIRRGNLFYYYNNIACQPFYGRKKKLASLILKIRHIDFSVLINGDQFILG